MQPRGHRHWVLALLVLITLSTPLAAIGGTDADVTLRVAQASGGMTSAQAAARAKARYGGQVLSVKRVGNDNSGVFRVKILLPGGRVKMVRVVADAGG